MNHHVYALERMPPRLRRVQITEQYRVFNDTWKNGGISRHYTDTVLWAIAQVTQDRSPNKPCRPCQQNILI
ncbi:hypothetical protein EMIT0196P_80258 [Pseudomonas chlororaphis]